MKLEFNVLIQKVRIKHKLIKKKTDFITVVIIDSHRFCMARASISMMIPLVNEFSNHTLLPMLIELWQNFSKRNFFFLFYLNFSLCTAIPISEKRFMPLNVIFHTWMNIGPRNIIFFLFEMFFMNNISLNMITALKKFKFWNFFFNEILFFFSKTFHILILYLNLIIFVTRNINVEQTIKKKKSYSS